MLFLEAILEFARRNFRIAFIGVDLALPSVEFFVEGSFVFFKFVALLMGLETFDLEHSLLFFEVLDCLNGDLAYFEVGALRFSISLALWSRMKSFSATSSFVC